MEGHLLYRHSREKVESVKKNYHDNHVDPVENKGIFLCGKPKAANEILTRGGKIIVAMTAINYDKAQFSVANLRQCYIPFTL